MDPALTLAVATNNDYVYLVVTCNGITHTWKHYNTIASLYLNH